MSRDTNMSTSRFSVFAAIRKSSWENVGSETNKTDDTPLESLL